MNKGIVKKQISQFSPLVLKDLNTGEEYQIPNFLINFYGINEGDILSFIGIVCHGIRMFTLQCVDSKLSLN